MSKKLRVAVLCGGRSAEHEVSINSAKNIITALDKDKYEVVPIGIGRDGRWHLLDSARLLSAASGATIDSLADGAAGVSLPLGRDAAASQIVALSSGKSLGELDVVIPVLHGPYAEDGTVQGLLKLANLPFVGCGVLASAVGMDKDVMKRLLRDAGLPIGKFMCFRAHERSKIDFKEVEKALGMPCFVKPANMGSSVGISKASSEAELAKAVDEAFKYDSKLLIEEAIVGREIEFAVIGNENPVVSAPGEIRAAADHGFYSYDAKYIDDDGAELSIPAAISDAERVIGQKLAKRTYEVLCAEGLSRVDMFLRPDGSYVINEINTFPGFTNISMYPKLFEASGIPQAELLDKLIELAITRFKSERRLLSSPV